jgi:hypothetical protein
MLLNNNLTFLGELIEGVSYSSLGSERRELNKGESYSREYDVSHVSLGQGKINKLREVTEFVYADSSIGRCFVWRISNGRIPAG